MKIKLWIVTYCIFLDKPEIEVLDEGQVFVESNTPEKAHDIVKEHYFNQEGYTDKVEFHIVHTECDEINYVGIGYCVKVTKGRHFKGSTGPGYFGIISPDYDTATLLAKREVGSGILYTCTNQLNINHRKMLGFINCIGSEIENCYPIIYLDEFGTEHQIFVNLED